MKKTFSPNALLLFWIAPLLPVAAHGVTVSAPTLPQNAFRIEIEEPFQSFTCRDARKITYVSLQKYVSSQATEISRVSSPPQYVTEMTIDFDGAPGQIRIYAMEEFDPLRISRKTPQYENAKTRLKTATNKLTQSNAADVARYLVVKTYPHSTHAKTVEFRVPDAEEVVEFYKLFSIYYLRERRDYRYHGSIKSENAKLLEERNFLGLKTPSPAKDWEDALKAQKITRSPEMVTVSGLGGLCFTLGTPDTIATEIERQDVNKK